MSTSARNPAAEEQAPHELVEEYQADDFTDDEGIEETVHVRRTRAMVDQINDEDPPPLVPAGRPPPPPPGRPGTYQPPLAPRR
ncbi:MAG: hypothetical protein ACK55I_24500, partial [bacterium]